MAKEDAGTRERIVAAAAALMRAQGLAAVTYDAVAARIGLTKQAVIYWFPSKADLIAGVALPCLSEEAAAAIAAARAARGRGAAARAVVLALVHFHLADLARFRLVYAAPQVALPSESFAERVHPITREMYGAIADALGGGEAARMEAVALHMAALGHVLLVGLTEAAGDPLRHSHDALAERLAGLLAAGAAATDTPQTD
jgi:AcrR family transcriptional regulator